MYQSAFLRVSSIVSPPRRIAQRISKTTHPKLFLSAHTFRHFISSKVNFPNNRKTMSLLIANPIHASSNDMHINDFEIEDILSNMDSFISEENMLFLPTTEDAIDGFAPVSPDHVDAFSEDESRPKTPTGFQVPNPLSIPAPVSPPESPKPVFKVEVRAVKPKLTKKQATDKQANAKNRKRKISSVSSNAETKELTEEELQGRR